MFDGGELGGATVNGGERVDRGDGDTSAQPVSPYMALQDLCGKQAYSALLMVAA